MVEIRTVWLLEGSCGGLFFERRQAIHTDYQDKIRSTPMH